MTEHDWQPIAEEDPSIMCTVCFECKCCSDWTDECPREWVPEDDVQYADSDTVMSVAQRISEQNAELMRRLS
jgi:hypothetical protein